MHGTTSVIVGASRGIGLEFVKQLLQRPAADAGAAQTSTAGQRRITAQVVAAVRDVSAAPRLYELLDSLNAHDRCIVEECDVSKEESIESFTSKMKEHINKGMNLGTVVLNAGILQYPNRATEVSFSTFALHIHTNTIGPIICAQKLLNLASSTPPKIAFISSDSGSTTNFLSYEDGFAAYGASKAALNQMLRHMAAELQRSDDPVKRDAVVLAMHPGEVMTEMANVDLGWEVKGSITATESVEGMLQVIAEKGKTDTGTFWCWDGRSHPW